MAVCRARYRTLIYLCVAALTTTILLYLYMQHLYPTYSYMTTPPPVSQPTTPDPTRYAYGLADPRLLLDSTLGSGGHLASRDLWTPTNNQSDSLLKQLRFLDLLDTTAIQSHPELTPLPLLDPHYKDKLILVTAGVSVDPGQMRREVFLEQGCAISNCYLIDDLSGLPPGLSRPDSVVYKTAVSHLTKLSVNRQPHEVWVVWQLESPLYASMAKFTDKLAPNWTATYRSDSTLVTPYDKYVTSHDLQRYGMHHLARPVTSQEPVTSKTKLVAWFVSNCKTNNGRMDYVEELKKHIQVDIFGGCGPYKCSKQDAECTEKLRSEYKFYLSLENSNCRQYVTEKLFENAFTHDVVPVVMGAHPDDYRAVAPPHSYIHVDDFRSPKHLAEYLKLLDKNDTLYNEYFRWKGTGSFINTKFWCRLCAMLHARDQTNYVHTYKDLSQWWRENQCVTPRAPYGSTWRMDGWSTD